MFPADPLPETVPAAPTTEVQPDPQAQAHKMEVEHAAAAAVAVAEAPDPPSQPLIAQELEEAAQAADEEAAAQAAEEEAAAALMVQDEMAMAEAEVSDAAEPKERKRPRHQDEALTPVMIRGYKVQQLRDELTKRGLASDGVRQVLMQRLEAAISP